MPSCVRRTSTSRTLLVLACALVASRVARAQSSGPQPWNAYPGIDTALVSGVVYLDYGYRFDKTPTNGTGGCPGFTQPTCRNDNRFEINRVYLNFRKGLGTRASVRVTTDIFQQTDTTKNNNGFYKGWVVRLKYGYLQYQWIKDTTTLGGITATARLGSIQTVILDWEESYWPRWLGVTANERNGFQSSADLGASTFFYLPKKWGETYFTITNGPGYTSYETTRYKTYSARASLTPLGASDNFFKSLSFTGWASDGAKNSKFAFDTTTGHLGPVGAAVDQSRWGGNIGLRNRALTGYVDYAERSDGVETGANTAASPDVIAKVRGQLYDGFVLVRPLEVFDQGVKSPVGAIFRYDHFKPNKALPAARNFFLGGVFWDVTSRSSLALDLQYAQGVNGDPTPTYKQLFLHWQGTF